MNDIKTFATRKEAKTELALMAGWDAHVIQMFLPEDENANKRGNAFVITVRHGNRADEMYLRGDGYVN